MKPEILNEWDGFIESIGRTGFCARVKDPKVNAEEVAEFPLNILSNGDRKTARVGRYLRWIIYRSRSGEVRSKVYLRQWRFTKKEIRRADRKAKEWTEFFNSILSESATQERKASC